MTSLELRKLYQAAPVSQTPGPTLDLVPVQLTSSYKSIRKNVLTSVLLIVAFFVLVLAILTQTQINGAVVTNGMLVVESNTRQIQHPTGGVVGAIMARDGDHVGAGQVLLRLDNTAAAATYRSIVSVLNADRAHFARLAAERDGATTLAFPPALVAEAAQDPDLAGSLQSETRQFEARLSERLGQKNQLQERINQSDAASAGLRDQIEATDQQINLVSQELDSVKALYDKRLVSIQRMTSLQRDAARLYGERAALVAQIATEKGRVAELQIQMIQIQQTMESEVAKDITETQSRIAELSEKKVVAADTVNRVDVVAPQAGVVQESTVHTVGGVIQPGATIMTIVPENDELVGEVHIAPNDINRVYAGQPATVQFSALDRTTTPSVSSSVALISPDLIEDRRTGLNYYLARIVVGSDQIAKLGGASLRPGMPIEVFLLTGERTIMSYLTKPLTDQVNRTFR